MTLYPCPDCRGQEQHPRCKTCRGRGTITEEMGRRRIAGLYLKERRERLVRGFGIADACRNLEARGVSITEARMVELEGGRATVTDEELLAICTFYGIQSPPPRILAALLEESA